MRCTRCDQLAVPQAVGLLPKGLVVFGWCLDCLQETGCTQIEAVARRGPPPTPARVAPIKSMASVSAPFSAPPLNRHEDRGRAVLVLSLFLVGWATALITMGVWSIRREGSPRTSPLGNGMPAFFLAGGVATAATAIILVALSQGRAILASRTACRWIQSGTFLLALAILLAGIVFHDRSRDPFVVATAGLCLGLSVGAHWRERRLPVSPRPHALTGNRLRHS